MTYQFKIQIKGITKPPVWRRVTVPANYTFWHFHIVIQVAFGWENAHLFKFSPKGFRSYPQIELIPEGGLDDFFESDRGEILEARETALSEIFKTEGEKYTYIYDFGDSWEHQITLEEISDKTLMYPDIIKGKGACPIEDCGGSWAYENFKEILTDPKHPEYKGMAEWIGLENNAVWDPHEFDLEDSRKYILEVFTKQLK